MPTDLPTNDPTGAIHDAMAAILDEVPAVGKDSTNTGLNFNFRGIEAILNALNPLLGKHGVVPRPVQTHLLHWEPKTKGYAAVVQVTYRLTARDGSWVEAEGLGEGHDFGDKAVSKATTMAQKMMLGHTFAIAYDDDPDGDTVQQPAPRAKAAARATKAATPATPSPAVSLEQLRAELFSTVKALAPAEIEAVKTWLGDNGLPLDFSAHDEAQVDAIRKYLDETFESPF